MKNIYFVIIMISFILFLSSCNGRRGVAEYFCPPSEFLMDTPLWMRDIGGSGGLAIEGCNRNNSTCPLPYEVASVVITERDDAVDWSWKGFQAGAFYRSETSKALAEKNFDIYNDADKNVLVVSLPKSRGGIDLYWLVSSNFMESGMQADDLLLAVCPTGGDVRAARYGCDRVYRMGQFDVKYRFNGQVINKMKMLAIDDGVASAFHGWRCQ